MIPRSPSSPTVTQYLKTIGGKKPHRRHAKPLTPAERKAKAADLRAKGERKRGDSVSWLRRCLYNLLRWSKGALTEIDLVQIANSGGYHIRTIRAAFKALMEDPSFNEYVQEWRVQKRLKKNGTFVILVCRQSWRLHDGAPLYWHTDGTKRHLRRRLREPDLPEPDRRGSAITRSSILQFPSSGQQIEINKTASGQNPSSVAAGDTDSSNCDALTALGNEKENESPKTLKKTSYDDLIPNLNSKQPRWVKGQLLSDKGRKALEGKIRQTLNRCEDMHWIGCRVKFEGKLAHVFIFEAMRNGQPDTLIERAWEYGIKKAHADAVDGLARVPSALALSHARRFLENHTTGTLQERIDANYRKKNFKKRHGSVSSPSASFQQGTPQKANPKTQLPPLKPVPASLSDCANKNGLTHAQMLKATEPVSSWAKSTKAILDKIMPSKFHPGQVQTGGSPGASESVATPKPQLQTPAKTKPESLDSAEKAARRKAFADHLHVFLSSFDDNVAKEWPEDQAKKDSKKS